MFRLTIIIPTKNRLSIVTELLRSLGALDHIERLGPEIIVVDNDSHDNTYEHLKSLADKFPTPVKVIKVAHGGKSAALNDALNIASGDVLAFLDDDVVVDRNWLNGLQTFFRNDSNQAGQGVIRLAAPQSADPEILKLVERYRTIPKLEYKPDLKSVHSLNGANFFVSRKVFDQVGGFDERLGPGASGTSEDVDFAHRLARANITIGYAPEAIVYHRVDRDRLTEEYFKQSHRRQGVSRFLMRKRSAAEIAFNLARAAAQYCYYSITGTERARYRSKGRIHHYIGMMEALRNQRR